MGTEIVIAVGVLHLELISLPSSNGFCSKLMKIVLCITVILSFFFSFGINKCC